jgi:hypothetical protein
MSTTKLLLSAVALATAAFGAVAQEATPDHWMSEFRSQLTRAEVRAEVLRPPSDSEFEALVAEAMGFIPLLRAGSVTITLYDEAGNVMQQVVSAAPTRAGVRAELQRAKASGEFARLHAEAWDFQAPAGAPADTRIARR